MSWVQVKKRPEIDTKEVSRGRSFAEKRGGPKAGKGEWPQPLGTRRKKKNLQRGGVQRRMKNQGKMKSGAAEEGISPSSDVQSHAEKSTQEEKMVERRAAVGY